MSLFEGIKMSKVIERHKSELNPNVTLIEYINKKDATYECTKHGIFKSMPYMVRRYVQQCPKCRVENPHNRATQSSYEEDLVKYFPQYKLIGPYVNRRTAVKHGCKTHRKEFDMIPYDVYRNVPGCPECKSEKRKKPHVSETDFIGKLKEIDSPIKYVSGFTRMKAKALFRCKKHKFEWEALPDNVLQRHLCPQCKQEAITNSAKTSKPFKLGRRTVTVQGYEPIVLKHLLEEYRPAEIKVHGENIGNFNYIFQGSERITFPDFYIKKKDLFIEVKSTYTFTGYYAKNKAKAKGAEALGINMDWYIAWESGKVLKLPRNWHTLRKAQVLKLLVPI
jgi:predicted Zn-ribbon and HTH transcriptional regulator